MQPSYRPTPVTSKFIAIYTKLLQGVPPSRLDANGDSQQLFSDLLDLNVDAVFLSNELQQLSKEACTGRLRPFLSALFETCLTYASAASYGEARKDHALETLVIVSKCCLSKNLSGWEVMEIVAGSVGQSDRVFNGFTSLLSSIIGDNEAPVSTRCHAVRLGLAFVCAISQLSAGAYFLRRNSFPSILNFMKCSEGDIATLESAVFLAILANYHKSDAAKMNSYLKRIKTCEDEQAMKSICRATAPALDTAVRAYTSAPTQGGFGALNITALTSLLRPDRLLLRMSSGSVPKLGVAEMPQPVAHAVALLPIYEFISGNPNFTRILLEDTETKSWPHNPWIGIFLNLSSHMFTNTASSFSPRTMAYASLSLEILLVLVESGYAMDVLSTRGISNVQLCQQRLPRLPTPKPGRPILCDILDCCSLWLRHNMNRQIAVHSYSKCIWICHRIVWYLQQKRIRFDYEWKQLWISVLGLFSFLANKSESLITSGGIGQLLLDGVSFLELAILCSEAYLPTPQAMYDLVYELVRNTTALQKQQALLDSVIASPNSLESESLRYILDVTLFYNDKISSIGAKDAPSALGIIAQEVELNGLHRPKSRGEREPQIRAEDILDFARHACADGLALV